MTFSNIFTVIARNLKIYSNSKLSSLIIIIGPLILMIIIGSALQDNSLKNIEAGIFSSDGKNFTDNFIDLLKEKSFEVNIENSLENCKESVIEEINHVCIHLKKNQIGLEQISPDYESYDVDIYVDFSKQRIVWDIIGSIQGIVEKESYSTRKNLIKDIGDNVGDLNSRIIIIENGLNNALVITSSLKQENSDIINNLNSLKLILSNTKQSLESIQDAGILGETYNSTLLNTIRDLNSSNEKLDNIKGNQASQNEINNIEDNIQNIKSLVITLKQEIDKLKELNVDRLTDPIILSYYSASDQAEGSVNKGLDSLDYLFPSFLIFFLLFDSLIFSTIITIKERSSNSYIRNITSKNNGLTFIIGNLLTTLLLISIQISIIIFIASFFLNLDILLNVYSLIPIILISILIFSLMGTFIGYLFNSYETATISSISLSLLLFIFSSIISPVEMLSKLLSEIIKLSPLTLLETKLRIILIFNSFFGFDLLEILSISLVFLIFSILIWIFYRKFKEKEI